MLGRSLGADPIFQWVFGGQASASDIAEFALGLYARPTELGMVWEAGDGRAVAVWVPPGAQVLESSVTPGIPRPSPDLDGPNRDEVWTWIESFVPDDTWYLEVLGVDPDAQGAGLGGALIQHGLDLAGAADAGAFLETSVARNVPYYERFGFAVVEEHDMPGEGPRVWFMRVDP